MSIRWHNDWFPLPGQAVFDHTTQQVAAVSRADGHLDLFVIGFDNHVWTTFWTAQGGWNRDWFPLPGQAVFDHQKQQMAAVSRAPGNLDLFVIGFDNKVWTTFWTEGGGWNRDFFPLPGQAVFDREKQRIAAVSRAPGNLDLFVVGFDNKIWTTFWTEGGGWNSDFFPLPGRAVFDRERQHVAAVSRASDNLDLFVIGNDNHVWTTFWTPGTSWNADWFPLPGQAVFDRQTQQVAAVSRAPGNLDVFVIGNDDKVWSSFWTQQGGWNADFFPLPGRAVFDRQSQRVSAVSRASGHLDLFVIGNENHVWSTFWNERGWSPDWFPLPGKAVFDRTRQQVAAVSRGTNNLDLFVIGLDNKIWTSHWGEHANDKPWAVILCRFKDDPADPNRELVPERFFKEVFTPGTGGLVEYWQEVSHGGVDVTGSRVFGWVTTSMKRIEAGGIPRAKLIDAGISAAQAAGMDPITGFHKQMVIYTRNWSKDGAPPGADWTNPDWAPFWIDGSADGQGRVCLTPPFNGNITAHEMGHGFGMGHDVGANLMTSSDYADPACIMSQNGPFDLAPWNVSFGPALCVPHMVQKGWMPPGRLFVDDGNWMRAGITVPLAPLSRPGARANLGIQLRNVRANPQWDYYLEYCLGAEWNRGVPGAPYLLVRRMVSIPGTTERPAYLLALHFDQVVGGSVTGVETSGNVRFTAQVTSLEGPILKVTAEAL